MAAKRKAKKKARDMTTEEAIRALFPKKLIDRIRKALAEDDEKPKKRGKKPKKSAK